MKKVLGFMAAAAAACCYVAYKVGKEEPTEEERVIYDSSNDVESNKTPMIEVNNESTEDISNQILKNVEDQQETSIKDDDEFAQFKNLTDADIREIAELSQSGLAIIDKMEDRSERPIQHLVEFDNEDQQEKFKSVVIEKGYVVTSGDDHDLAVLHISKIDKDDILSQVFYLADLTKELAGKYKGWSIK